MDIHLSVLNLIQIAFLLFILLLIFVRAWRVNKKQRKMELLTKYNHGYQQGRFDESMESLREKNKLP